MEKSILKMSRAEVQLEKFKLEQAGLLADSTWYLDNLLERVKNDRRVKNV